MDDFIVVEDKNPMDSKTYNYCAMAWEVLSLRDWFAGMAMQGDISASGDMVLDVETLVGWSYEVANAMMEARDG